MNFLNKKTFTKRGFTLIEMLIVIVIIGVLASALIPRLGSARGKANDVGRKADLQQLATAIISYQIDSNYFPQTGTQVDTDTGFQALLIKGGMASIPNGDIITPYTGADGNSHMGYYYIPLKKNGGPKNGFVVMSRAETEGGANFVKCSATSPTNITTATDVESVHLCSEITVKTTGCTPATGGMTTCVATDKSQLLYLYKY